ncbi:TAXI family TRAP transporter solute-binding subunit [Accumulibacter sp.]|uniref:TAXI family TRAP transporter solute-binding subunit n=1 Tax=Accumulibacter sp. TaxID=2053492 RepID=UPI0025F1CE28|nr:TAXI family TRAP transporter solute-binding subunit [Accumulibacter sp.]MCM8594046.1 TAXI family TRAP transporter solute-binding subunit [Accumulibacter sp.]MDS4048190.1 TAXI family TRAP transporter solute-binding subunit [Accumulibacter sp.]
MSRRIALAGFLAIVVAAVAAAWIWFPWVFSANYTIRVATGPLGGDAHKFVAAFKRELSEQRPRVRLLLEETANLQESGEALENGKVDLAVVRSDHPAAANGGTILIIRPVSVLIMVDAQSSVKSVSELSGKKLALLEGTPANDPLLRTVIDAYGLRASDLVSTPLADVGAALQAKRVAAVLAMGSTGPGPVADAVKAIVRATRKPPTFLDIDEAKAITARSPVYEETEIPAGGFLATPAVPDDSVSTVSVSVRLVARNSMLDYVAGEMTRLLMVTRAKLAATVPGVGGMSAPDTDKKQGVLPVHPGTAAYLDGTQESLFDQAMTQLFNFSIIGGILGSLGVWLSSQWRRHRPDETQRKLQRLPAMLVEAKTVPADRLDDLEEELDALSAWFLERFAREQIDPDRIGGLSTTISEVRQAIRRRRTRP